MNKLLLFLCVICFTFAGCAALQKTLDTIAPPAIDVETGEPIPGSREPTELAKGVADVIPYGETGLAVVLFLVAGYERIRAQKLKKGLMATLMAGKRVSKDPETARAWEKIKETYKREHETANVYSMIKTLIAKLPKIYG